MRTTTLRAILILFSLFLFAEHPSALAATSPLNGTSWVLSALGGQLPLSGTTLTLVFGEDDAVSGSDGCNRFTTTFTASKSTITIATPVASTMMACTEAVTNQANEYMTALDAANRYQVRGSQLILLEGNQVLATYVAAREDLADTTWLVTGYNNGREAVVSPLLGADIIININDESLISGNAGCNDFFASIQAANGAIEISGVGATRRTCSTPAGVMEQETEFFAALESAETYTVEGDFIELRNADDAIAVQMVRQIEVSIPEPEPAVPTGRVTAPNGVNVRTGPGTNFPTLGVAPFGATGEIIGRSADSQWWVVAVPSAPGGMGWVSADFVAASNAEDVPIIASPPPPVVIVPTPAPTPTPVPQPTATPTAQISFSANPTTINQGQCSTLQWSVENVQAVWVYPQGQPYQQFPQVGQGSQQVCPPVTTTYEMRVLLRDGSVTFRQVTVTVVPAAPQNPLNNTNWQVTSYNNGQGAVVSPLIGTTLTAMFQGDRISGNAGCNTFSGSYWVSGGNISISGLVTSMMACADPAGVMEQEQQYIAALQSAATFRFDGSRLELRRGDGALAVVFTRLQ